ncbi:hypothetical protein M569_08200, partial [Genlisea aurea]
RKPHAIMLPYPYQGHINPFARLAVNLAAEGFTVTFVNTRSVDGRISRARGDGGDIFGGARDSGLDIRYATVCDGFPLSFDRVLNHDRFVEGLIHVFPAHVDEFFDNLAGDDPPATCLISDTFYVWGSAIARKHNLVYVSFWTEPALVFSLYYHLELLINNGDFDSSGQNNLKKKKETMIHYIPGVEAINPTDLPSYLQSQTTTVVHRVIFKAFDDVKKADMIICNTVQKLEEETLSALHRKQPTYAVGPIISDVFTASLWSESDCSDWLSAKPKGSVLYVSFGSHAGTTSRNTISEISLGLLMSEVNFIWVIRPDIVGDEDSTSIFPDGFNDCLGERGLIVRWCNQFKVLSDPAIGGFLSHCGWNSVLESIRFKVPIICFPLFTDQFTNRRLVVNDWKVGINLCDRGRVTREEVREKIRFVIGEETSEVLRKSMADVGGIFDEALRLNGSSVQNFKLFIEEL